MLDVSLKDTNEDPRNSSIDYMDQMHQKDFEEFVQELIATVDSKEDVEIDMNAMVYSSHERKIDRDYDLPDHRV